MQFGRTLARLLFAIRHANPKFGPVRISKADIKDGFYRLFLRATDCLRLAIVLPRYEGEPQLIGIPSPALWAGFSCLLPSAQCPKQYVILPTNDPSPLRYTPILTEWSNMPLRETT